MTIRILLVEDEHLQADRIEEEILAALGRKGVVCEIVKADTESRALAILTQPGDRPDFNLYLVDVMLPWARGEEIEEPGDPRVRQEGPLYAGFRVIEAIRKTERAQPDQWAPIILYTSATLTLEHNGHQRRLNYHRLQKTDDLDAELVNLSVKLLAAAGHTI